MSVSYETSFLVPSATFVLDTVCVLVLWALTVLYPFIGAVLRRQWGWALAVFFLGPFTGIPWLLLGRTAQPAVVTPPRSRGSRAGHEFHV